MPDLTPHQALAYDTLFPFLLGKKDAHLAVLEGYAGVGKTTLVAALLAALPGLRVAVAAPTNKAVRVLRDKLVEAGVVVAEAGDDPNAWKKSAKPPAESCTCRSIHAFLGLKLKELEGGRQEAVAEGSSVLRDYDAVIVDECSMLDDALFQKIVLERGRARVLFVGDPAQLPPVARNGALSPVFERVDFKVRLTDVVRQAADNPIIRLSIRLRQMIEAGVKATPLVLLEALPPATDGPKAALVGGTSQTLVDFYLSQREDDPLGDTRIIAYTNSRVQHYNRLIHRALHGATATRFVAGETVIVQTQCEALNDDGPFPKNDRLITSEELTVVDSAPEAHPFYPHLAAERVRLRSATGAYYRVWVAADEDDWRRRISACFAEHRAMKAQGRHPEALEASDRGWALQRAFAPLRHAYAITCHKSQGSTFDCALVDFTDLAKMPDAFQFNRALYVAATRSREFLALVVT